MKRALSCSGNARAICRWRCSTGTPSSRRCSTCSTMRSNIRPAKNALRCVSRRAKVTSLLKWPITASASRATSRRKSSSSFTASTPAWCTTRKAAAWAWRLSNTSSKRTAGASRSKARRAKAAVSPSCCRFIKRRLRLRWEDSTLPQKILVVEDEPGIVLGLRDNLEYEGFEVCAAADGEEALRCALEERPDLILLDLMLPKLSGLDVCRQLRRQGVETPVIMLTARGQEIDKVLGLEIGADDYVTKPFSIRELLARVRAQLRRAEKRLGAEDCCRFGAIELNFRKHQAWRNGQPFELSPREFALLKYFLQHRGETVTRDQLLDEVWGYDNFPLTRTVDNHIARLRQKIEANPAEPQYI